MPDGTLSDFESRVEQDRADLAASLDRLAAATDPKALEAQATDLAELYGQQAMDIARRNPAAVALIGLGATMLIAGLGARSEQVTPPGPYDDLASANDPVEAMEGFDARVAAADRRIKRDATGETGPTAAKMRAALESGLERLPGPAKRRIIDLRLKAIDAQEKVERRARRTASKATGTIMRNPIQTAALALGFGALVGALMPSTRIEDEYLGTHRDRAMSAATDALQRERDAVAARMDAARAADRQPDRGTATAAPARS